MRFSLAGVVMLTACTSSTMRAGDEKGEEPTILKRADLEKLEGVWALKADPKEGWKGTVRATITIYKDRDATDFGYILYDFDLADGANTIQVTNDPIGGISFAGVKRGKTKALVTSKRFARPAPFKVDVKDELSAAFEVKDEMLTLDLSKSLKAFVPDTVREMKIDWSKAVWEKVK
jgi:hypothetical protein